MKKMLFLGMIISSVAMANVIEVKGGVNLANSGTFSDGTALKEGELKNGFSLSAEYRFPFITEEFELGAGIGYYYNSLNAEGFYEKKGLNSVPIYATAKYSFKNSTDFTPYIKYNVGYSFNSGNLKWKLTSDVYGEADFKSGFYTGASVGLEYKNFIFDLAYDWKKADMDLKMYINPTTYQKNLGFSHGTVTLGIGYTFKH